jgi:hypothetical protein
MWLKTQELGDKYVRNNMFFTKTFNKNKLYVRIIVLNDDMFQQHFKVLDSAVHYVIKCTGTEEKASEFKNKFQLRKRSKK